MNPCQLAQAVHRAGHETTNFVVRSKVKVTLRPKIDLRLSRGIILDPFAWSNKSSSFQFSNACVLTPQLVCSELNLYIIN